MRIAIIGGGMAGLAAAFDIARVHGMRVDLYESANHLGGLASGFKADGWEWPLERAYHHIFASDTHITSFLREIGYAGTYFTEPITASLYEKGEGYVTYPVDGPVELLTLPLLSPLDKTRAGLTLAMFKVTPFLPYYSTHTTSELLRRYMGERGYETLFGEMIRKKFGKYAGNILASFIWSRIHMRTKRLGYMAGGFQSMIDAVADSCHTRGVTIHTGATVRAMRPHERGISLDIDIDNTSQTELYDKVISTLPTPHLADVAGPLLSHQEIENLRAIKHLGASNLILETQEPVFAREYWVSVCTPRIPALVFVQHTNFVDRAHYGGRHILYIASYCEKDDPHMTLTKEELLTRYIPIIESVAKSKVQVHASHLWRTPIAQPIFDREFLSLVPRATTSHPHLYLANLDMTYPFDRGTNYAVKLGREAASLVIESSKG